MWLHHAVCCDARRTRRIQELIALMISNGLNIVFIPSAYRHVQRAPPSFQHEQMIFLRVEAKSLLKLTELCQTP